MREHPGRGPAPGDDVCGPTAGTGGAVEPPDDPGVRVQRTPVDPETGRPSTPGEELAGQMAQVVHELRGPLATTMQVVDLLDLHADDPPDPRLLDVARRQLNAGLRRVDQLLTLLREPSGGDHLDPRPHVLRDLVEDLVGRRRALEERHRFETDVDPDIEVLVDRHAFEQMLDNLLGNASRHAPADSTIRVLATARDDEVHLRVVDDGPGIDPELGERALEPFVRGRQGGSGLGLAVVRQLVEAHGGRIWLETDVHGSFVVLALPTPAAQAGRSPAPRA